MNKEQMTFGWDESPSSRGTRPSADGSPARPADPPPLLPRALALRQRLAELARRNIYLGTSSWKYPGWLGQVYEPSRYQVRGKFSERKFNQECLAEYAGVFPTVGGDFAFYQFPRPDFWRQTFSQVPDGFRFSLKIPEEVTVQRFPNLPRYGRRAGEENPGFMDAGLLRDKLLSPLEPYRDKLGVLMFEFGTIHAGPLREPGHFARSLGEMLAALPLDRFAFAVEVRNRDFLAAGSDYLACLRSHGVAHCLNSWTRMPSLLDQLEVPGVFTAPHVAARLLLRPGRGYQQAVDRFSPYQRVQEVYPEGRAALREMIDRCQRGRQSLFAFVNNRFEGNAVETIESVVFEH